MLSGVWWALRRGGEERSLRGWEAARRDLFPKGAARSGGFGAQRPRKCFLEPPVLRERFSVVSHQGVEAHQSCVGLLAGRLLRHDAPQRLDGGLIVRELLMEVGEPQQ